MAQDIAMRLYKRGNEVLLAACDSDLMGRTFKEGNLQIEVAADFYDDVRVDKSILIQNLQLCTISNLVGEKTINIAIEAGIVNKECVIWIQGIPHAQTCTM